MPPVSWTLRTGDEVTVVKLDPEGRRVTDYPGVVVEHDGGSEWLAVSAFWTRQRLDIDGLVFEPGDQLIEYFSLVHWFNVFAILEAGDAVRGWYANVSRPTRFDHRVAPPEVIWPDLYLDLIAFPDGRYVVRDEDELEAVAAEIDRKLLDAITLGKEQLIQTFRSRAFPFSEW